MTVVTYQQAELPEVLWGDASNLKIFSSGRDGNSFSKKNHTARPASWVNVDEACQGCT